MASRLTKAPLPLIQAQRTLSAQAGHKKIDASTTAAQTTKSPNGVLIATAETKGLLPAVGVMVKSGSMHETYDNLGVSHAMRCAAGLATKNHTSFGLVRNLQQVGSCLQVTHGREYTLYSAPILHGQAEKVADYLFDIVSHPQFKRWEVPSVYKLMKVDRAEVSPAQKASELLHAAAYRSGLGNSIISPEHMIGKHGPSMLNAFHKKTYTAERAAIVGVGVDHSLLAKLSDALELEKGNGADVKSKYIGGGDERSHSGGKNAYVAIATEGPPGTNPKEAIAAWLLQAVLGMETRVKHGVGAGKLQKAVGVGSHAVAALNYAYMDSSLLGAFIATDASSAGQVVEKVAAVLRSVSVTEDELKAAKKALTVQLSEWMLNPEYHAEFLGCTAVLTGGEYGGADEQALLSLINQASLSDVQAVAKKLSGAKLSIGACGNLGNVPFADTL